MKLKRFFVLVAFSYLVFLYSAESTMAEVVNTEAIPDHITIGLIPGGSPANLKSQSIEFAKQMQADLNVPVNIIISKDYQGLSESLKNKKVDFAFLTAMTYVSAEEKAPIKVLLKKVWSDPFYFSALIARKESGIKNINQIKNKKVVFVDSHSASGFLYPQVMLKKKGIKDSEFKTILFSGNHSKSIEMLEKNEADVAAVFSDDSAGKSGAWVKFAQNKKIKYQILWVSDPIPNDPFVVRQDFYDKYPNFTHTLMMSMIDLFQKNKQQKIFSEILGNQDLMPATSRQYDPVREMVKSLNPDLK